jgi:hypothetical protein
MCWTPVCASKHKWREIIFIRYVSGIIFISYTQSQKIGKSNKLKVFWSKKTKGPKQKYLPLPKRMEP